MEGPFLQGGGPDTTGELIKRRFLEFLENFSSDVQEYAGFSSSNASQPQKDYLEQIRELRAQERTTLYVDFHHVAEFDSYLAFDAIEREYYRFEPYLRKAVQNLIRNHEPDYIEDENEDKEFWISIYNLPRVHQLRELRTEKIGQLVSVQCTVTRTSEVRPELLFGTFRCLECGTEAAKVDQQFKFTQPPICSNSTCHNRDKWHLVRNACKFVDWQRVRCQENSAEVPAGSLPRSLDVILRHEIVESARAGDKVILTGYLMVVPDAAALVMAGDRTEARSGGGSRNGTAAVEGVGGLKGLGVRELHYRLCFMANAVVPVSAPGHSMVNIRSDEEDADIEQSFTPQELEDIKTMSKDPQIYSKLVKSIAPSVFGHDDIKRAVLLMLFGGVHKETAEGIQLRGDINAIIVGDPSCAKSQFLKYVADFLPRAVYTSGKSSSAAGLTATVAKEPETGEFCIEAGALMLADNGICCIDEFDKMDVQDQVAIHEAMEQQTISVAKAGIHATLNARTSILAAANPAGGRYDKSKPLKYNVALPPAILSRFDLVHVMVDEIDELTDYNIANHIVMTHRRHDSEQRAPYSKVQVQRYIKRARAVKPVLSEPARAEIVKSYTRLRMGDAAPGTSSAYRITVRQLEALVRLSEALARMMLSPEVLPVHVAEARRMLSASIIRVDSEDIQLQQDDDDEPDLGQFNMSDGAEEPPTQPMDTDAARPPASQDQAPDDAAAGEGQREEGAADAGAGPADNAGEQQKTEGGQQDGEGAAGGDKEAASKVTLTYEKYQQVSKLLVTRLRDSTEGLKQAQLMRWYMDKAAELGNLNNRDDVRSEYRIMKAVIQNMVRREGTLLVIEEPTAEEIVERPQLAIDGRVLALNPNYTE